MGDEGLLLLLFVFILALHLTLIYLDYHKYSPCLGAYTARPVRQDTVSRTQKSKPDQDLQIECIKTSMVKTTNMRPVTVFLPFTNRRSDLLYTIRMFVAVISL
jgi:hypothetical protein